jgi:hypothetical protein
LRSIADLLEKGPEYLDGACSLGELRKEVWDTNYGGKFPSANGAATEMITSSVMKRAPGIIRMPDNFSAPKPPGISLRNGAANFETEPQSQFRRYQTLHVLHCKYQSSTPAPRDRILHIFHNKAAQISMCVILLGASATSGLFGLFGTSAAILSSALFQLCRQFILINRPSTYLLNNEASHNTACMLVGIHQNASTWHLYIGERGIVDSLLNKPMIMSVTTVFGDMGNKYFAVFLRLLALLQLLSMTFVAAQGGWDGIGMLMLIIVAWLLDLIVYGDNQLARSWLSSESVNIKTRSFQFSGRAIMIGAIQAFKENPVQAWVDEILAPSDRRNVWLDKLKAKDGPLVTKFETYISTFDQEWVERNLTCTEGAVEIMRREFPGFP